MFTPIADHVAQALKRLIGQYKNKLGITSVMTGIVTPIQDIENALVQLNTQRDINNAIGNQLDRLGTIIGLDRVPGDSDATYRQKLKAEIVLNVSDGVPEQVIQAFQLLTGAQLTLLDEGFYASIIIESKVAFPVQAAVDTLLATLLQITDAGVRIDGIISFDPNTAFSMDGALPGFGFGDTGDASVGGFMSTIHVDGHTFAMDGNDPSGRGFGDLRDPLVGGLMVSL